MSIYKMQIIHAESNTVVEFEPGREIECDFIVDCVERIIAKGVGVFRTSAHVEQDVKDGIQEAIFALKSKVRP